MQVRITARVLAVPLVAFSDWALAPAFFQFAKALLVRDKCQGTNLFVPSRPYKIYWALAPESIAGFSAATAATGSRTSGHLTSPAGFFPIRPRTAFSSVGNCSSNPTTPA